MFKKGACLIISGPSGSGKSTLIKEILKEFDDVYFSISTTTRPKREGEIEGVDYYFVTKEEFEEGIKKGLFLEWANVHGNYYGTSIEQVQKALSEGKLVIFDIDVQGFEAIMKTPLKKITTSVFVTTPTMSELKRRLKQRGIDDEETIEKRLQNAKKEIEYMPKYEFILINENLEKSKELMLALAKVARLKKDYLEIEEFIKFWINN